MNVETWAVFAPGDTPRVRLSPVYPTLAQARRFNNRIQLAGRIWRCQPEVNAQSEVKA